MEKPIHTRPETRNEQCERLKAKIVELLQCTPAEYAEVQYREGLKYLKYYLPNDQKAAHQMSACRVFWNWWKNHWSNRDQTFICLYNSNPIRDVEIRRQLYAQYNNGKDLSGSIHPNSVVLNETYPHMIKELIKAESGDNN